MKSDLIIIPGDENSKLLIKAEGVNNNTLKIFVPSNVLIKDVLTSEVINPYLIKQIESEKEYIELGYLNNLAPERLLNNSFNIDNIYITYNNYTHDYIVNNKELMNREVFIHHPFNLNNTDIDDLVKNLGDLSNIKILPEGNYNYVTVKDYINTLMIFNNIIDNINNYELSEIEKIMYVYDMVKSKVYKESIDKNDSRNLSTVLNGNDIVCVGYAALFNTILNHVGINSHMYYYKHHVRNIVRVTDSKYNIDGMYYFDPTWDSRESVEDKNYINNYMFFCKTKEEIDKYTSDEDVTFPNFNRDTLINIKDSINKIGYYKYPSDVVDNHVYLSQLAGEEIFSTYPLYDSDLNNTNEILDKLESLYFPESLDIERIANIVVNMRNIILKESELKR